MRCYVVLWIPTLVYTGFDTPFSSSPIEKNISDIPGDDFFVKVELISGGDFSVSVQKEGVYEPFVLLHREQVSSNGLIEFSYEKKSPEGSAFCFTENEFPSAIYHIIKSFYHLHNFHEKEADSSFLPYISSRFVFIRTRDNDALRHYLRTYGEYISNSVNNLQTAIQRVREKKEEIKPESRSLVQRLCTLAQGFEVFMGVLYRSKYNTICKTNSEDRNWRHLACNIENGLRYVRTIENEYAQSSQRVFVERVKKDAIDSLEKANQSIEAGRRSLIYGRISVVLGLVSIVIAFCIAQCSSHELSTVRDSLEKELDSIPTTFNAINTRLDSLSLINSKIDTLSTKSIESINNLTRSQQALFRKINEGE